MNPEYPQTEGCYMARLERTMRDIPDKYHEFLWHYTGQGNAPHVVQGAVTYIESSAGLEDASNIYNTNQYSVSLAVRAMIDRDVVTLEEVLENNHKNGYQVFAEGRSGGKNQHSRD